MTFIFHVAREALAVLLESAPFVLLGFAVAGLLKAFLPPDLTRRRLGGPGVRPVLAAALLGVPLPLCSCGVVPAAVELRRSGASKGATAAFLVSTPETGVDSILVNYALLDPLMTVLRPLAAFCTGTLAGLAVNRLDPEGQRVSARPAPAPPTGGGLLRMTPQTGFGFGQGDPAPGQAPPFPLGAPAPSPAHTPVPVQAPPKPDTPPGALPGPGPKDGPAREACRASGCGCARAFEPPQGVFARLLAGQAYAFGEMLRDVGAWLLVGIVLAGVIGAVLPPQGFANLPGGELGSMLAMLVLGLPLYVCATASTPVAAALALHGLSPGAALVFMLSGPATNAAGIVALWKLFGAKSTLVYLLAIAVGSLAFGMLANALYGALGLDASRWLATNAEDAPGLLSWACAAVLVGLTLRPFFVRVLRRGA